MEQWRLNTSNMGKFAEFQHFFAQFGASLEVTHDDLREIDAEPLKVIAHKASQLGDHILVEDTSLEIEGASVGINIRWLLNHLSSYVGRRAEWVVLLAYHSEDTVKVFRGSIFGTIVEPRGQQGFGFDPIFQPEGELYTLAESKPDHVNARGKAVEALIKNQVWRICPAISDWNGPWQEHK